MDKITLTTAELVAEFGTDKQKASYTKSKYLNARVRDSILKSVEAQYETVEIAKEGRSNVYHIAGKREIPLRKVDGREANGAYSIQYTKNMDILVVALLEEGKVENMVAQTMRKWLLDFGLISEELFDLTGTAYSPIQRNCVVNNLLDRKILASSDESKILNDYVDFTKELQGQLESTLKRMEKAGIINFYPVYKAKIFTNSDDISASDTVTENIHEVVVGKITAKKTQLREKHNVSNFDIIHLKSKKEVVAYERELNDFLQNDVYDLEGKHLCIDFYWKAHAIHIKSGKNKIEKYLNKYNAEAINGFKNNADTFINENYSDYRKKRTDRVVELAHKKDEYMKKSKFNFEIDEDLRGLITDETILDSLSIYHDREYYKMFLNDLYIDKIRELEEVYNYNFN